MRLDERFEAARNIHAEVGIVGAVERIDLQEIACLGCPHRLHDTTNNASVTACVFRAAADQMDRRIEAILMTLKRMRIAAHTVVAFHHQDAPAVCRQ